MWNWLANRFDTDAAERCENNPSKMIPFDTLNAPKKVQEELSERFKQAANSSKTGGAKEGGFATTALVALVRVRDGDARQ